MRDLSLVLIMQCTRAYMSTMRCYYFAEGPDPRILVHFAMFGCQPTNQPQPTEADLGLPIIRSSAYPRIGPSQLRHIFVNDISMHLHYMLLQDYSCS